MGPVFGVDTHLYRQEFAKSRGMIHWHGLCWRSDKVPHSLMHKALEEGLSEDLCAKTISDWAKNVSRMTACHPAGKSPNGLPRKHLWLPPEGNGPAPSDNTNPFI